MNGVIMSNSELDVIETNSKLLSKIMKTPDLYKKQSQYKKTATLLIVTLIIYLVLVLLAIWYNLLRVKPTRGKYEPNKSVSVSNNTDVWEDNFDSTFVYNGCLHYTHKS